MPVLLAPGLLAMVSGALLLCSAGCRKDEEEAPKVPVEPVGESPAEEDNPADDPDNPGDAPTAPAGPVLETEPNDSRATASTLPVNGGLRGSLSSVVVGPDGTAAGERSTADEDWFVLSIPGQKTVQVRIQMSPEDSSDFTLQWMQAAEPPADAKRRVADEPIASIDNAREGGVEVLAPALLAPGRHYFRVIQSRSAKAAKSRAPSRQVPERPYRLTTTVVDPTGNLEQEPNDTYEQAGVLRPGEPREGYLGWFQDGDWYRLDLASVPQGSVLRIDVSEVAGVKSRLWLVNKRYKGLVKVPEGKVSWAPGRAVTIRDVGLEHDATPYYVEVRTMRSANPLDRYTIRLTTELPETAHEREPNWRPANASELAPDAPVDGYIGHPTDWDVFRLDAEKPMIATVVASGVPDVDLQTELIDASQRTERTVNELGPGGQETLPLIQVGPRPAFVRVSSKGHTYNTEKGYRIAVTYSEAGDREVEPNDDFEGAARVVLPLGKTFKGFIHPRGDADHYTLDVSTQTPDETRILTVTISGAEGLNLGAYLYDSERALITKKAGIAGGETKTFTHGFSAGRYYVRVRDESGQAANGNEAYTIMVGE